MVVGFVGRLEMEKGLKTLARALNGCRSPISIMIVGDGQLRTWLAGQLKCSSITFLGHLEGEQLARATASLDVFVTASRTETFGLTTLEAMACGVPVVAFRATGSQDLVVDGVTGRLVDSVRECVDAIELYRHDTRLRKRHGHAGQMRSRSFQWDACHEKLLVKYKQMIGKTNIGAPVPLCCSEVLLRQN